MNHIKSIYEFVVPMGISLDRWKDMQKKGMTAKKYHEENPDKKFKVVHGHKRGEIGKPLPGATNLSYEKATKQHKAIVLNENIKSFDDFNKTNEELTRDQRLYLNIPRFLGAFLTRELLNQYPMLNFRWRELKRATKKSGYDPLFYSPSVEELKDNVQKITKDDIPKNRLGLGMFLRDWNIYLSERKSKGGAVGPNAVERPVIYLTKDKELKVGDKFGGYRINDRDIYPDFKYQKVKGKGKEIKPENLSDYPIVVLAAKFDQTEKVNDINQYIDDICLELEDDLPVDIKPTSNAHGDKITIPINIINKRKELNYSEELFSRLEDVGERIKDYLNNTEGYDFDYSIDLSVVGPFYYYGNKGRFKEIIEKAKEHTKKYQYDSDNPMWDKHRNLLNISGIWASGDKVLRLHPDDIRTLISDIDNCYKSIITRGTSDISKAKFKIKAEDIKFRSISIRFFKQERS